MNYTSASVMHFSLILFFLLFSYPSQLYGDQSVMIIEKVLAVIDDEVITMEDYSKKLSDMKKRFPEIKPEEVMDMMINRILLLREARKMGIMKRLSDDEIINEYIDIKIRSSVFITEEEMMEFYDKNKDRFKNRGFNDVAHGIEHYLREQKTNKLLEEHIKELRRNAYIRIFP